MAAVRIVQTVTSMSKLLTSVATSLCLVACAAAPSSEPPGSGDPGSGSGDPGTDPAAPIPEIHCDAPPDLGAAEGFRHTTSSVTAAVGDPVHRGLDLVVSTSTGTQQIAVELGYGLVDKALEDEDVEMFACDGGSWKSLGIARTDSEGLAVIVLTGTDCLQLGIRDLYASVVGDCSDVWFLGVVAPDHTQLVVSDIDGTLTSFENAFVSSEVSGSDVAVQPGAPEVFQQLAAKGYLPIYVTARPRATTEATRQWLASVGMPLGALRLSPGIVLPGSATVDYKTGVLHKLQQAGLELALGNGNRASDLEAYTTAGLASDRITLKLPEYQDELADALAAGDAIGFTEYSELDPMVAAMPAGN